MFHFFDSVSLKSDRKISMEGIRTIWVKTSSQQIVFQKGEEELDVKEYLYDSTDPAKVEKRGDALCLELGINSLHMKIGHTESEKIEIYMPADFTGQILAESASGSISLEREWNLENVQIQTASGNIHCGNLGAQHFLIKSKSGDINILKANGDRQFSTVSGNIKVDGGAGDTKANTVSGNLRAEQIVGAASLKTVSGGLDACYRSITGQSKLESASGNIHVTVPDNSRFALEAVSKSGNIAVKPKDCKYVNQQNHHVTALIGCNNMQNIETSLSVSAVSGNVSICD